jgi:hypothetical protein
VQLIERQIASNAIQLVISHAMHNPRIYNLNTKIIPIIDSWIMHRVRDNELNCIRSYLPFDELHASRVVCRQWNRIRDVPKTIKHWCEQKTPPDHVSFSNIVEFAFIGGIYSRLPPSGFVRIISESRDRLQKLVVDGFDSSNAFIPPLPSLKKLFLEGTNSFQINSTLLKRSLNIKELHICSLDAFTFPPTIDLQNFRKLESFSFEANHGDDISILNLANHRQMLKISLPSSFDGDKILEILRANENVTLSLRRPILFEEQVVITSRFIRVIVSSAYEDESPLEPTKLKAIIQNIWQWRKLTVCIEEGLTDEKRDEALLLLRKTDLFDDKELLSIATPETL